ncbi:MAG: 50S ribosomal protein L7/L12 [Candidatus Firestonebacteria bacterium]
MADLTKEDIIKGIENMSVIELSELIKVLEERFGVSAVASAPVAVSGSGDKTAQSSPAAEEQTTFSVVLTNTGDKKIQVIKVVREITGLGLKESKDLVEGAPKSVKEGVTKEEAEKLKAKFEGSGATIEVK